MNITALWKNLLIWVELVESSSTERYHAQQRQVLARLQQRVTQLEQLV